MEKTKTRELKPEQRKRLITALLNGNIEAAETIHKEITGEKVIIRTFLDLLIYTSDDTATNKHFEFAPEPGPFRDFIMKHNLDEQDEIKPALPGVWMLPADMLTDEEIELYMEQDSGKLL